MPERRHERGRQEEASPRTRVQWQAVEDSICEKATLPEERSVDMEREGGDKGARIDTSSGQNKLT